MKTIKNILSVLLSTSLICSVNNSRNTRIFAEPFRDEFNDLTEKYAVTIFSYETTALPPSKYDGLTCTFYKDSIPYKDKMDYTYYHPVDVFVLDMALNSVSNIKDIADRLDMKNNIIFKTVTNDEREDIQYKLTLQDIEYDGVVGNSYRIRLNEFASKTMFKLFKRSDVVKFMFAGQYYSFDCYTLKDTLFKYFESE